MPWHWEGRFLVRWKLPSCCLDRRGSCLLALSGGPPTPPKEAGDMLASSRPARSMTSPEAAQHNNTATCSTFPSCSSVSRSSSHCSEIDTRQHQYKNHHGSRHPRLEHLAPAVPGLPRPCCSRFDRIPGQQLAVRHRRRTSGAYRPHPRHYRLWYACSLAILS